MQVPSILQGQSLKRLLQGAAVGAVTTIVIGFNWGGWTLGGTAKEMAQKSASSAVVAVLAPICVDKFQHATDSPGTLVELKKISSWQQGILRRERRLGNVPWQPDARLGSGSGLW